MLAPVISGLSTLNETLLYTLQLAILFAGSLLLWRLWRFTLMPMLKPNEPKELPYWIPCMQHPIDVLFLT